LNFVEAKVLVEAGQETELVLKLVKPAHTVNRLERSLTAVFAKGTSTHRRITWQSIKKALS
jgi:hypothetical protein